MGFWVTVGKVAWRMGVFAPIGRFARARLARKADKVRVDYYALEDAEYEFKKREAIRRDQRERARAAR